MLAFLKTLQNMSVFKKTMKTLAIADTTDEKALEDLTSKDDGRGSSSSSSEVRPEVAGTALFVRPRELKL